MALIYVPLQDIFMLIDIITIFYKYSHSVRFKRTKFEWSNK